MKTHIVKLRGGSRGKYKFIARQLVNGSVAAFPTDTVYGLGADYLNAKAVSRIYRIKGRSKTKQLILMVGRRQDVFNVAENVPPDVERLIKKYWPGPLTLILNASLAVRLATGKKTVGVRMPGCKELIEILKQCPRPLATTSANISGGRSCCSFQEVKKLFDGKVDLIIDGGIAKHGKESTILDVSAFPCNILREGVIKKEELAKYI